ncbi:SRPBCC family protein [Nannocystaceae bacterium ST9]
MHHHDFQHIADGVVGAAAIASTVLANPLLRAFYRKWGATEHEAHRLLPGDELIESPRLQYTRAITIAAPPERVWPWLIQIGQGRAGWYSYDVLEDMVGAGEFVDGESAERVVPELQALAVGDEIPLHDKLAFRVERLSPPHLLLLCDGRDNASGERFDCGGPRPDDFTIASWAFVLEDSEAPEPVGGTRLLIRWRLDYTPTRSHELMWKGFVEPINFVMERRMMLGIKARVESAAASSNAAR